LYTSEERPNGGAALLMQLYGFTANNAIKLDNYLYSEISRALKEGRAISFDINKIIRMLTTMVPSSELYTTLNSLLDPQGRVIESIAALELRD
jgi:hypothetical protein